MKSNQIKDIVKEIQRVVPSIMELKFGCRVIEDGIEDVVIKYIPMDYDEECSEVYTTKHPETYQKQWRYTNQNWEILGREITLQDLLLCIYETGVAVSFRGSYKSLFFNENQDNEQQYDLTKSVLENLENDEFREFIYQLICK